MPKDWDPHKAEIERLYMVERLTLKDVRNIMKTRFAFDASIRAYRMKFDEWQFWKNNSKNDRRAKKTSSRRRRPPPAVELSDSKDPVPSSGLRVSLPPPLVNVAAASSDLGHMNEHQTKNSASNFSETLRLISSLHFTPVRGLEQMLNEWKPDGSYLKGALTYLDDNRSRFRIFHTTLPGITIFHEITPTVLLDEAIPLAKMCLEIDFEQAQKPNIGNHEWDLHPNWMKIWRAACASRDWQEVVKYVNMIDLEPVKPGLLFTSTALPFLAEKILQRNLEQLQHWSPGGHQFDACLRESVLILSSFIKADKFDVDKIWYKRFLQFKSTHITQTAGDTGHRGQLEEYRRKILQLKTLHQSIDQSEDPVQNLLNAANILKESKVILDATRDGDLSPAENVIPTRPTTPVVIQPESSSKVEWRMQTLIESMYKKWSWGNDIQDDVDGIWKHLKASGLSNPTCVEQNPFVLISRTISSRDQVCFTAAFLACVQKLCPRFRWEEETSWSSWLCISMLRNLTELQATVHLPNLFKFYLIDEIGPNAVELVLRAFTVFAADIILSNLKQIMLQQTCTRSYKYIDSRYEYMKILDELQARKLRVDQEWTRFLGMMLSWELIGVVNSSMLESSGEESDGPNGDSTISEEESDGSDSDSSISDVDESEDEQALEVAP